MGKACGPPGTGLGPAADVEVKGRLWTPDFGSLQFRQGGPKEVIRLTLKQISSLDTRWSNCSLFLIWHARIQTTLRFTLRSQPVNIEFRRTWSRCRNLATSGGLSFMYQKTGRLNTSSHGTWRYVCVCYIYIHIISAYNAIAWICWRCFFSPSLMLDVGNLLLWLFPFQICGPFSKSKIRLESSTIDSVYQCGRAMGVSEKMVHTNRENCGLMRKDDGVTEAYMICLEGLYRYI